MAIDYRVLRSLTARGLVAALNRDGFSSCASGVLTNATVHPDGRCVTVAPHAGGDTFTIKTLKSIIQAQARWTEEDLKRLKLL
jgi:predicted RNA binding protein YcfA (HicA-like mRNA interferase family)